ncbi:MAG: AAA family ATPase [Desulfomonilaceae bacterium]|nr:AAA family ATPase [Desulfomonilaceae bacterium]
MKTRLDDLIHAMSDPTVYPHRPESVHVIQTHISVVFIAGDLVYKVKKPVDFGFLNFTTLEKRRHFCRQEVLLNSRFSEGVYLGVVSIYQHGSEVNLRGEGDEIETAVLMRRIPADRVLEAMLENEDVTDRILDRVADRVAFFHSTAASGPEITGFGSVEVVTQNLRENFEQTQRFVGLTVDAYTHREISDRAFDWLESNRNLLKERMTKGFIRDCHGDLHLDHVVILNGIMLVDCIEFNDRFRFSDTAADLAFLLMDFDFKGFPAFGNRIARRYSQTSGDRDVSNLIGFYKSYRAFVRGKVNSFSLEEEEVSESEKTIAREKAREYFRLASASLRPAPGPFLVVTAGLSGSGKSYLSSRLGRRLGTDPIRSDVVRKQSMGIPINQHRLDMYGQGIYTPKATEQTYRLLMDRAGGLLRRGESVILDASFMRYQDRVEAREEAHKAGARFVLVECVVPECVARRRLEARVAERNEPSDARWEIFLQQKSRFEAIRRDERQFHRQWDSTSDVNRFLTALVRDLMAG